MKKILCALTAAIMLAVQCAVYAETDTAVNNITADNDIELTAKPVEDIIGDGDETLTADEAQQIKDAIAEAVEGAEPPAEINDETKGLSIDIPEGININAFNDDSPKEYDNLTPRAKAALGILENFLADNPELFYFNSTTYSYTGDKLTSVGLSWGGNAEDIQATQNELDAVTTEILTEMRKDGIDLDAIKSGTDEEKKQAQFDAALWLHDYLADTITYDYRAYDPAREAEVERTIDAALLGERLTVCEGYAKSYKYILEKIGMECVNVYSDTEHHEWSAVKIGDAWYYVDVTQDDGGSESTESITHNFFLVTADELLANTEHDPREQYTHHNGYITEKDIADMEFGTEFEGKPWHGNLEEIPAENEEGESTYTWNRGVLNTRVVFDGSDRYYGGFDNTTTNAAIYKCGANLDLDSAEKFRDIDDGLWYTTPASESGSGSYISGYFGGLGKYTYEGTDGQRACLYFNSPTKVYELELGAEEAEPKVVAQYTYNPEESDCYNCIFGISTHDTLKYHIMNIVPGEDNSVGFEYAEEKEETIACNVRLYEGTENPELMDILTYPVNAKLNIPDYKKYGVVLKGWVTDLTDKTPWDFETALTESIRLYADVEAAHWKMQPQLKVYENCLTGTVNASIADFDDTYREAPTYMLAIYDNNTLVAVKTSDTGEFKIAPEDNIPYTETTAVKVYAWSSENEPYLGSAPVRIQRPSGEGETGGETGGDEGEEAGNEGSGTENEGDNENEGGGETGNAGSETGSGETGENTGE